MLGENSISFGTAMSGSAPKWAPDREPRQQTAGLCPPRSQHNRALSLAKNDPADGDQILASHRHPDHRERILSVAIIGANKVPGLGQLEHQDTGGKQHDDVLLRIAAQDPQPR